MPAADFISQSLLGRDSGLSIWWVYVSVPVGSVLLALHFLFAALALLLELFGLSSDRERR
jgi:TRAP-type C4-dicarboxylate transport system permease small subunit